MDIDSCNFPKEIATCLHKNFGLIEGTYIYSKNDNGTLTVWQCPVPRSEDDLLFNTHIDFESKILEDIEKSLVEEAKVCSVLMKMDIDIANKQMLSVEMVQKNCFYESIRKEYYRNSSGISVKCGNGKKYFISVDIIPD